MHQALSSPDTAKSSIFGISDDERKELLAIWEEKLALQVKVRSDNTVVGRFYECVPAILLFLLAQTVREFWKVWPIKEPMACIFAAAPLVDKSKPISNIIIYMMNALKNPVITVEHLMKLCTYPSIILLLPPMS